ncbi:hypothetical protein [Sphingomonas lenta]|uniref:Uncharacterized protein n=1 Tax=Sphingomonas lenta TaxID=1141887 RepID=A0A2A2SCY6_9SPHN|nr:hypothetical protein [Sphingomonas lenta]PAX07116.1 hypothetical protein CKY28_13810 [Sphingomonas lenta]
MIAALLLCQAAPDIELRATARARSVEIERAGEASLTVRSDPPGGDVVDVRAPRADGRRRLRDVRVDVVAEARIADPQERPATESPR